MSADPDKILFSLRNLACEDRWFSCSELQHLNIHSWLTDNLIFFLANGLCSCMWLCMHSTLMVGGVAQWLGRRSLAGGLTLIYG